jgi:hypothetical protein
MLKDKFIHDTLGIPLQTLQKWKKSEGHNFLLYQYLVHQNKDKFQSDAQKIIDFYDYEFKTPGEFSHLIEQNWEKFPQFDGYKPEETTDIKIGDDKMVTTIAFSKPDSSKLLDLLVIRYAYTLSRRKEIGLKEIENIVSAASQPHINHKTVKIVYVTTSGSEPSYFKDAGCNVSILTYTELYKTLSDKKILIV